MANRREIAQEPKEFELKLEFDPADATALEAALARAAVARHKQTLLSVYYDTADAALRKAGASLRVRDTGSGYLQTLKSMDGAGELFERSEWESMVTGPHPDLSVAAKTAFGPLFDERLRANLRALFQTRIDRDAFRLEPGGTVIEAAFDRGEIEAGEHRLPVHELELELVRGDPAELFRLARGLAAEFPLRLVVESKAERGYRLAAGANQTAEKAMPIELRGEMSSAAAFRAIGENCLRQIAANASGVEAHDADSLHQMRIGLRRFRSALDIFKKMTADSDAERIRGELKWIAKQLGPARDLDVFATDVLEGWRDAKAGAETAAETMRAFAARHAEAYANATGAVGSDRFRAALLEIAGWIVAGPWTRDPALRERRERLLRDHASKVLARERKRIRRGGENLRELEPKERHKLRLRAKTLRYATEFFAEVFPGAKPEKRRAAALSALKDLQDELGALNDLERRASLFAEGQSLGPHAEELLATEDAATKRLLMRAESAHAAFAKTKPFWN